MEGGAVGAGLRALRVLRGLTVVEAARRAGVSRKSLQRWEAGQNVPRGDALAALLSALEASPQERTALLADFPAVHAHLELTGTPLGLPVHPGHVLRALRESRAMTQARLAEAVGVSQAAVAKWEAGLAMPGAEALARATAALGAVDHGLREDSLELYDPITDPDDARRRLREVHAWLPEALPRQRAIERELWPLAARDPRWEAPLAETLSFRAYNHFAWGDFTLAVEAAQRALRLAESANAWNVVGFAISVLAGVREARGADPARLFRFYLDCAERTSDPFARAGALEGAGKIAREHDPRRAAPLFGQIERLIRDGEPTEFSGDSGFDNGISVARLDELEVRYAIAVRDRNWTREVYERTIAEGLERHLVEDWDMDLLMFVVEAHGLLGARQPDAVLELLDAEARAAERYWERVAFRRINPGLGLFVPNAPVAR